MKKTMHGMSATPTYRSWYSMKDMCTNRNHKSYKDYGGRGITFCERWEQFVFFYKDMGAKPVEKGVVYVLDRKDPNGNYGPGNCRWLIKGQGLNRRTLKNKRVRL